MRYHRKVKISTLHSEQIFMDSNNATPVFRQAAMSKKNICKLSAVMFTDIKGFSRRMGESEHLTLKLLRDHNRIIRFLMRKHNGRIVKSTGDGYLIDFDSAVVAVQCAVEAQQRFQRYNEGKPESDQIFIRIGISLGEVMIVDGDLFGDEVNIAARVQTLAEPGGVCITREVYERVKSKLAIVAVNMGPQDLKNIRQRIEIYKVCLKEPGQAAIEISNTVGAALVETMPPVPQNKTHAPQSAPLPAEKFPQPLPKRMRARQFVPVFSFALVLVALASWNGLSENAMAKLSGHSFGPAAQAGLVSYGKTSGAAANAVLAVAPFENRTHADGDDWLSDGLADMMITDLQGGAWRIVGRTQINEVLPEGGSRQAQAFSPETAHAKAQKVPADYVLRGAVARHQELLRIDVQLFEVKGGELLFAEKEQGENILVMMQRLNERLKRQLAAVARR